MTPTITDISDSADIIWVALTDYEDGNLSYGAALKMIAHCSAEDRQIFHDEIADIDRKRPPVAPAPRSRRSRCPKITGFDYERAILTSQGY